MKDNKILKTMSVQELIDSLNKIEDKTKPVFAYPCEETNKHPLKEGDITMITYVDSDLNGRVDLSILPITR